MKFASFKGSALKSVGAVSLCVALGAGLAGCGGNGAGGGAVAATVNGQDILFTKQGDCSQFFSLFDW